MMAYFTTADSSFASPETFIRIASAEYGMGNPVGRAGLGIARTFDQRFRSNYGTSPLVCALLWNMINPVHNIFVPGGVRHHHLLWALAFLTVYGTESVMRGLCGNPDEKTFRKWAWVFVIEISRLFEDLIRWENRLLGATPGQTSFITIDAFDTPTHESRNPFWTGWWSFKYNGPGLRYELGVAINTNNIVWMNGPFPPRSNTDSVIFSGGLQLLLLPGETVEADRGYRGLPKCNSPYDYANDPVGYAIQEKLRARHEAVNKYIRKYGITYSFRHEKRKHELCIRACVVLAQLGLQNGEPVFQV